MTNAAIREQLRHYIDIADESKLDALYRVMEQETASEKYTPAELAEFYTRLEKVSSGEMPYFSVEDAHNFVRENRNIK